MTLAIIVDVLRAAVSLAVSRKGRPEELLLVERSPRLRSFAGYLAFPGGTLDDEDAGVPIAGLEDPSLAPFLAAGARELFEETGIWLGRGGDPPVQDALNRARRELLEGDVNLATLLERFGQKLEAEVLSPLCRITTPPFAPVRFDTWFLRALVPDDAAVEVWDGELVAGSFIEPAAMMERWRRGEANVAPPMVMLLDEWAKGQEGLLDRIRALTEAYERGVLHRVYFSPGVLLVPLRTPTQPPATHTNTLVFGEERLFIVDPSPVDADEQARLWDFLDALVAEGRTLEGILLTHYHPDHVGALVETQRRYAVPARAHRECMARLPEASFGDPLGHGDRVELGRAPDGSPGWHLTAYHVPGHAPGHLAFQESRYRALAVGDLVSTLSSILIDPRDGHLRTYLDSLRFLETVVDGTLYPGHGPPVSDGAAVIRKALAHRREREEQLLAGLADRPQSARELVERLYTDVPAPMHGLAERSLLSGLLKLEEDGRARRAGRGWVRAV